MIKKQNKIKILYKIVFITNDVCAFANEGAMNQTHWRWTHSVKVSVEPPLDKVKVTCNLRGRGSVMCFPYNTRTNAKIPRAHVNPGCVCGGLPGFQSLQAWRDGLFRSSWLARLAISTRSEFYWDPDSESRVEEQWSMIPKIKLRSPQAHVHLKTCKNIYAHKHQHHTQMGRKNEKNKYNLWH